jgi:hypothetical protein
MVSAPRFLSAVLAALNGVRDRVEALESAPRRMC